jgi:hypothetical protein
MWTTTRRKLALLLEEQELLRRAVEALQYDQEELKKRVQRLIWRTRKEQGPTSLDESGASPDAGAAAGTDTSPGDTASTAADAPGRASKAPWTAPWTSGADPVSARLLARRRRLPVPPDDEPSSEG